MKWTGNAAEGNNEQPTDMPRRMYIHVDKDVKYAMRSLRMTNGISSKTFTIHS